MGKLRAFLPTKNYNVESAPGEILEASSTRIIVTSGSLTAVYKGEFFYNSSGTVFGKFQQYEEYYFNSLVVRVSDFSTNATVAQIAINTNKIDPLFERVQSGPDDIRGSNYADRLAGYGGPDKIDGRSGGDILFGDGGNDTILGGGGNDQIIGGLGRDTAKGGSGNDLIFGEGRGDVLHGGSGNDEIFGGTGNDLLNGQGGNDILDGGGRGDELFGGAGNDLLRVGKGNDEATGGRGFDIFLFSKGDGPNNTITDFNGAKDFIEIDRGASRFSDLTINQRGPDTVIKFADVRIFAENTNAGTFDGDDFIFS